MDPAPATEEAKPQVETPSQTPSPEAAPAVASDSIPADVPAKTSVETAATTAVNSKEKNASTTVLVTGGSGFIASHLILQLLAAGYTVRATLRSLSREAAVRKSLSTAFTSAGADAGSHLDRLTFYAADLTSDNGWADAVRGCTHVHHVVSPFPAKDPKTDDELVVPAREGALRVLRAACEAGSGESAASVKRVILTSSFAAIGYGHKLDANRIFTEKDWTVNNTSLPAYHKSKMLAERAAWDYIKGLPDSPNKLELTVINPVGTFGPVLPGAQPSPSVAIIRSLLDGSTRFVPQLHFGMVDVRDLADLHIRAMTAASEVVSGERFLAVADGRPMSLEGVAVAIRKERPRLAKARSVPFLTAPNWMVRTVALFDSKARNLVPMLGAVRAASNAKAKEKLGWRPRPTYETIMATVDSLVEADEAKGK
ncbi:hypothetical protein SEUCBS140593_007705 [Sporothrix eucalyptigena]|uniref:NAD-dependent epimerase/dehydratase domain-containing protein n=1 Tax=Sporothrix eucalyptigena TaxID=1812306 RepID=A0ABP0CI39_9PEZI